MPTYWTTMENVINAKSEMRAEHSSFSESVNFVSAVLRQA